MQMLDPEVSVPRLLAITNGDGSQPRASGPPSLAQLAAASLRANLDESLKTIHALASQQSPMPQSPSSPHPLNPQSPPPAPSSGARHSPLPSPPRSPLLNTPHRPLRRVHSCGPALISPGVQSRAHLTGAPLLHNAASLSPSAGSGPPASAKTLQGMLSSEPTGCLQRMTSSRSAANLSCQGDVLRQEAGHSLPGRASSSGDLSLPRSSRPHTAPDANPPAGNGKVDAVAAYLRDPVVRIPLLGRVSEAGTVPSCEPKEDRVSEASTSPSVSAVRTAVVLDGADWSSPEDCGPLVPHGPTSCVQPEPVADQHGGAVASSAAVAPSPEHNSPLSTTKMSPAAQKLPFRSSCDPLTAHTENDAAGSSPEGQDWSIAAIPSPASSPARPSQAPARPLPNPRGPVRRACSLGDTPPMSQQAAAAQWATTAEGRSLRDVYSASQQPAEPILLDPPMGMAKVLDTEVVVDIQNVSQYDPYGVRWSDDGGLCGICCDGLPAVCIQPCGHQACPECMKGLIHLGSKTAGPSCPFCRRDISGLSLALV